MKTEDIKYWTGNKITILNFDKDDVFVFGSNPMGIHGAGTAKVAMDLGAVRGQGRGMSPNNKTYALVTKLLDGYANFKEKSTGIVYTKTGYKSLTPEMIKSNIDELYDVARRYPEKNFKIAYKYDTWANGSPKKSLNGYTSQEMLEMFVRDDIPPNIVFHESYKPHLEKILNQRQSMQNLQNDTQTNQSSNTQADPLNNLMVVSPRDAVPQGFVVINTTSQDKTIGKQFSPFYLSDIPVYEGIVAKNMENAWQFAKVYPEFADENGNPKKEYFDWAKKGWNDSFAHRYANGKGNVPLYSYWKTFNKDTGNWDEHKYDYVTARREIYFPLYAKAIAKTQAFKDLQNRIEAGEKIALWDFDGYDHAKRNMSYEDVVNSDKYKCGHAFVIYGLLTKQLKIIDNELVYDFDLKLNDELNNETAPQYTYFFQATSPFSQWHPSLFTYKDLNFICAEQFMMYAKAKTFKDELVAEKIIHVENNFLNPEGKIVTEYGNFKTQQDKACYDLVVAFKNGSVTRTEAVSGKNLTAWKSVQALIKKLGREVANYDETVWQNKRVGVVSVASREKYNQNTDLKEILMNTGDSIMVEASPWDKVWGIGLDEATARKTPPEKWPGLNLLGYDVLTNLKNYYRNENNVTNKMKI